MTALTRLRSADPAARLDPAEFGPPSAVLNEILSSPLELPSQPRRRHVRRLALGAGMAVATTAAVAVSGVVPWQGGTPTATGWALTQATSGTVTVTITNADLVSPVTLNRALRKRHIRAELLPMSSPGTCPTKITASDFMPSGTSWLMEGPPRNQRITQLVIHPELIPAHKFGVLAYDRRQVTLYDGSFSFVLFVIEPLILPTEPHCVPHQ